MTESRVESKVDMQYLNYSKLTSFWEYWIQLIIGPRGSLVSFWLSMKDYVQTIGKLNLAWLSSTSQRLPVYLDLLFTWQLKFKLRLVRSERMKYTDRDNERW